MKQRIVELLRTVETNLRHFLSTLATLWKDRILPWLKAMTFEKAIKMHQQINMELLEIAEVLSH